MNYETLYENACEALRLACVADCDNNESDGADLYEKVTEDPDTWKKNPYGMKYLPALNIWIAARDELGKANGGTAYTALKKIVKNAPDRHADVQGVWFDKEGRQCACDGYRAVRLNTPVDGEFKAALGMDLEKVFPSEYMLKAELVVPTPGAVKIGKKKLTYARAGYDFGEGLPMVDAGYLLDVLAILPDAKCYATGGETSPLYFRGTRGDAILLPVRKRTA